MEINLIKTESLRNEVELRDLPDSPKDLVPPVFSETVDAYAKEPLQVPNLKTVKRDTDMRIVVSANYENSARYHVPTNGAGAAVTFTQGDGDGPLKLETGTSSTGDASCWLNSGLAGAYPLFDMNPAIVGTVHIPTFSASNSKEFYWICGSLNGYSDRTYKHFGFLVKNNSGTAELWVTFANGTTQTTRQITGPFVPTLTDPLRLHARLISGSRIEFYVNGTLVHTETQTGLMPSGNPSDAYNRIFMAGVRSTSGTTSCTVHVGPATISIKTL